jgi:hypothetical protein
MTKTNDSEKKTTDKLLLDAGQSAAAMAVQQESVRAKVRKLMWKATQSQGLKDRANNAQVATWFAAVMSVLNDTLPEEF